MGRTKSKLPDVLIPRFIEQLHSRAPGWQELVHRDAEFSLLAFQGRTIRGRAAIARALNSPSLAYYKPHVLETWRLGPDTLLVRGSAVYPLPGRGYAAGRAYWLDQLKDGLVWRARGFTSEDAARAAYANG